MRICVTGHRPDKLYGYDLSDARYQTLKETFKKLLIENHCTEAITGMALGADTIFALAVLELKDEGYDIKLHCAIPCKGQTSKWINPDDIARYCDIRNRADIVKVVSDKPYSPYLMKVRNEYMVDLADKVIAVWNGSSGGTGNCVEYAMEKEKEIIRITP